MNKQYSINKRKLSIEKILSSSKNTAINKTSQPNNTKPSEVFVPADPNDSSESSTTQTGNPVLSIPGPGVASQYDNASDYRDWLKSISRDDFIIYADDVFTGQGNRFELQEEHIAQIVQEANTRGLLDRYQEMTEDLAEMIESQSERHENIEQLSSQVLEENWERWSDEVKERVRANLEDRFRDASLISRMSGSNTPAPNLIRLAESVSRQKSDWEAIGARFRSLRDGDWMHLGMGDVSGWSDMAAQSIQNIRDGIEGWSEDADQAILLAEEHERLMELEDSRLTDEDRQDVEVYFQEGVFTDDIFQSPEVLQAVENEVKDSFYDKKVRKSKLDLIKNPRKRLVSLYNKANPEIVKKNNDSFNRFLIGALGTERKECDKLDDVFFPASNEFAKKAAKVEGEITANNVAQIIDSGGTIQSNLRNMKIIFQRATGSSYDERMIWRNRGNGNEWYLPSRYYTNFTKSQMIGALVGERNASNVELLRQMEEALEEMPVGSRVEFPNYNDPSLARQIHREANPGSDGSTWGTPNIPIYRYAENRWGRPANMHFTWGDVRRLIEWDIGHGQHVTYTNGSLADHFRTYWYTPILNAIAEVADVIIEGVHLTLDIIGLVPGAGEIADLTNAALYCVQGRYLEAAISLICLIPMLDIFVKGVKWLFKGAKWGFHKIVVDNFDRITSLLFGRRQGDGTIIPGIFSNRWMAKYKNAIWRTLRGIVDNADRLASVVGRPINTCGNQSVQNVRAHWAGLRDQTRRKADEAAQRLDDFDELDVVVAPGGRWDEVVTHAPSGMDADGVLEMTAVVERRYVSSVDDAIETIHRSAPETRAIKRNVNESSEEYLERIIPQLRVGDELIPSGSWLIEGGEVAFRGAVPDALRFSDNTISHAVHRGRGIVNVLRREISENLNRDYHRTIDGIQNAFSSLSPRSRARIRELEIEMGIPQTGWREYMSGLGRIWRDDIPYIRVADSGRTVFPSSHQREALAEINRLRPDNTPEFKSMEGWLRARPENGGPVGGPFRMWNPETNTGQYRFTSRGDIEILESDPTKFVPTSWMRRGDTSIDEVNNLLLDRLSTGRVRFVGEPGVLKLQRFINVAPDELRRYLDHYPLPKTADGEILDRGLRQLIDEGGEISPRALDEIVSGRHEILDSWFDGIRRSQSSEPISGLDDIIPPRDWVDSWRDGAPTIENIVPRRFTNTQDEWLEQAADSSDEISDFINRFPERKPDQSVDDWIGDVYEGDSNLGTQLREGLDRFRRDGDSLGRGAGQLEDDAVYLNRALSDEALTDVAGDLGERTGARLVRQRAAAGAKIIAKLLFDFLPFFILIMHAGMAVVHRARVYHYWNAIYSAVLEDSDIYEGNTQMRNAIQSAISELNLNSGTQQETIDKLRGMIFRPNILKVAAVEHSIGCPEKVICSNGGLFCETQTTTIPNLSRIPDNFAGMVMNDWYSHRVFSPGGTGSNRGRFGEDSEDPIVSRVTNRLERFLLPDSIEGATHPHNNPDNDAIEDLGPLNNEQRQTLSVDGYITPTSIDEFADSIASRIEGHQMDQVEELASVATQSFPSSILDDAAEDSCSGKKLESILILCYVLKLTGMNMVRLEDDVQVVTSTALYLYLTKYSWAFNRFKVSTAAGSILRRSGRYSSGIPNRYMNLTLAAAITTLRAGVHLSWVGYDLSATAVGFGAEAAQRESFASIETYISEIANNNLQFLTDYEEMINKAKMPLVESVNEAVESIQLEIDDFEQTFGVDL